MMAKIWLWLGTRAASGWIAMAGLALIGGAWFAYDLRGDKIQKLELKLLQCKGTDRQTKAIDKLSKQIQQQAQEKAGDAIEKLNALPNNCYDLDGPSPLNGLLNNDTNKNP